MKNIVTFAHMNAMQSEIEKIEKARLSALFRELNGNVTHTAAKFGRSVPTVRGKLIKFGLIRKGPQNHKP